MNFKQFIRDYFTFTRNERRGITILLGIIFLLAVVNKTIFYFETPAKIDSALLDSVSRKLQVQTDSLNQEAFSKKLFVFNPNVIDSVTLDSLDLPQPVKQNLLKFRRKGGRINSNSDFRKIYGVTASIYDRIAPYLVVVNKEGKSTETITLKPELFKFDPNTATDKEFLSLGLSEKQIMTIRNYQSKGGLFKNRDGFFKMWGLREDQKKSLADFITIRSIKDSLQDKNRGMITMSVEINSADSIQLKQLPGIGAKLSKRIVKYRDLLGGFYSVKQLAEVYGLNEQTILQIQDKVTVNVSKIRKLDVNFSDVKELSRHPYLKKELAQQIVKFRTGYGSIRDLAILRDSMILNIADYTRLKPYF